MLDGAKALALPTKLGQSLIIEETSSGIVSWKTYLNTNELWIDAEFDLNNLDVLKTNNAEKSSKIQQVFKTCKEINPNFLADSKGIKALSKIEFDKDWGLGSSSSMITNVAAWANIDPFELNDNVFGGSGYDIACANASSPIFYQKVNNLPEWSNASFNPLFHEQLWFVYLGKKKDSRQAIADYKSKSKPSPETINSISDISNKISNTLDIQEFEALLNQHEEIVAKQLQIPTIKQQLFSDYPKTVKSLGAWGGDFILVTGNKTDLEYFSKKGYATILSYQQIILNES